MWQFFIDIFFWLLLAMLVGLFVGWLIWGRREHADCSAIAAELRTCQADLDTCRKRCEALQIPASAAATQPSGAADSPPDAPDSEASGSDQTGFRFLSEPEGRADNLKRIRGIGPVLEKTLNDLGIFHFWQVARFDKDTIDRIDQLSFRGAGRTERENWVGQAKQLAAGEDTDFSHRYGRGKKS